jgi:geranylgeranyl pyrophosphate synthase
MSQAAIVFEQEATALMLLEVELAAQAAPEIGRKHWNRALADPLRDFLSRPGKEFRGELVRASYRLSGAGGEPPRELPLIVELLHAGSLIVDDIEDDSAARRGAPALHLSHGLPKALNAGNWLYFWPMQLLERLELAPEVELSLHRAIGAALLRSHYGQALDLGTRVSDLEQREVPNVVAIATELKTASLFELAATLGAAAAGASPKRRRALVRFAGDVGTGLQMLDDLGGLGSRRAKGREDLLLDRPTWPWAWLAGDHAAEHYAELRRLARDVIERAIDPDLLLDRLAERVGARGAELVHRRLQGALDAQRVEVGHEPVLGELLLEIQRLEASYG